MATLDEYKRLSDRQHAFRKGLSCETQLTTVINDWAKILDNTHACQSLAGETAIITDFSELFSLKRISVKYKNAILLLCT